MANEDKERFKMSLPVKLNQKELADKGELLANANNRYCEVEAEKKRANESFKEQLDECRQQMNKLANEIENGEENRMVVVTWIEDLDHNQKTLVRQDTGEVVKGPIALTSEERQQQLLS